MKISKKVKILDFKLSKILNGGLFGAYKSRFSGNGMEFSEHREYNFWDHVKNIDWKASSKTQQMFIKQYEEERDLNVLFVLDNTKSMQFGSNNNTKKDLLEEIFYSLSLSAYYNNDNIGGVIFDEQNIDFIDYKKTKNNIYKVLEILDKENKNNFTYINKFQKIFKYIVNRKIKDNLIFILTDNVSDIDEKLLRLVSVTNEVVYINIFDYLENNLVDVGGNISFGLGDKFLNIDTSNKNKVKEYNDLRAKKIDYNRFICDKNKIGYIKLDTKDDIFRELISYFSKIKK